MARDEGVANGVLVLFSDEVGVIRLGWAVTVDVVLLLLLLPLLPLTPPVALLPGCADSWYWPRGESCIVELLPAEVGVEKRDVGSKEFVCL